MKLNLLFILLFITFLKPSNAQDSCNCEIEKVIINFIKKNSLSPIFVVKEKQAPLDSVSIRQRWFWHLFLKGKEFTSDSIINFYKKEPFNNCFDNNPKGKTKFIYITDKDLDLYIYYNKNTDFHTIVFSNILFVNESAYLNIFLKPRGTSALNGLGYFFIFNKNENTKKWEITDTSCGMQ